MSFSRPYCTVGLFDHEEVKCQSIYAHRPLMCPYHYEDSSNEDVVYHQHDRRLQQLRLGSTLMMARGDAEHEFHGNPESTQRHGDDSQSKLPCKQGAYQYCPSENALLDEIYGLCFVKLFTDPVFTCANGELIPCPKQQFTPSETEEQVDMDYAYPCCSSFSKVVGRRYCPNNYEIRSEFCLPMMKKSNHHED